MKKFVFTVIILLCACTLQAVEKFAPDYLSGKPAASTVNTTDKVPILQQHSTVRLAAASKFNAFGNISGTGGKIKSTSLNDTFYLSGSGVTVNTGSKTIIISGGCGGDGGGLWGSI